MPSKLITMVSLMVTISLFQCCKTNKVQLPTIANPVFQEEDRKFADVYELLDGTWKGEFIIYEDSKPRSLDELNLKELTLEHIKTPSLKEINRINVIQVYNSESPYYQTVKITDYYPESDKKEISTGVNKVEGGKMWCIVRKPTETIIHEGSTRGENTIIWQSKQEEPQKIEYFQETVDEDSYEIIGYGYYSGDDTSLSPKLWFYSRYEKQKL